MACRVAMCSDRVDVGRSVGGELNGFFIVTLGLSSLGGLSCSFPLVFILCLGFSWNGCLVSCVDDRVRSWMSVSPRRERALVNAVWRGMEGMHVVCGE